MDKYNTFIDRFWASGYDGLFFYILYFFNRYLIPYESKYVLALWIIFLFSFGFLYSVTLHGLYGQTFGKYLRGIIILDKSESKKISFKQAILRDSFYIIVSLWSTVLAIMSIFEIHGFSIIDLYTFTKYDLLLMISWFVIELLTMLFTKKRRAFHDIIAGTVVIKKKYMHQLND
jgi:uncharacterized RDD family membrane protein YckC